MSWLRISMILLWGIFSSISWSAEESSNEIAAESTIDIQAEADVTLSHPPRPRFTIINTLCEFCSERTLTYQFHLANCFTTICSICLSTWISTELANWRTDGSSSMIHFIPRSDGSRQLVFWGNLVDIQKGKVPPIRDIAHVLSDKTQAEIAHAEAPITEGEKPTFFSRFFGPTLDTLKTCTNLLCCLCASPAFAEDCVRSKTCTPCCKPCGNPYFERCPHCLIRIERLPGCPHMRCKNPECNKDYRARGQVECPLGCCNVGCQFCPCGVTALQGCFSWCCLPYRVYYPGNLACWAIAKNQWKCRMPCLPCHDPTGCLCEKSDL